MKEDAQETNESISLIKKVRQVSKEESEVWPTFLLRMRQEAPNRIEEAAKFFFGVVSLSLAIFSESIFKSSTPLLLLVFIVLLWFSAILASLYVLFPFRYRVMLDSSESIQKALQRITQRKYQWLMFSIICYFIALLATVIYYFLTIKS